MVYGTSDGPQNDFGNYAPRRRGAPSSETGVFKRLVEGVGNLLLAGFVMEQWKSASARLKKTLK